MTAAANATLRLGYVAGVAIALLSSVYVAALAVGLLTLPSPDHQIQQPWFALMELLLLAIAPAMVALSAAVYAHASPERRGLVLVGVAFFAMLAVVTCATHFAILTLSRQPAFAGEPWSNLVFSFRWPSLAYALDILAWDAFFPIGAIFLSAAIGRRGLEGAARILFLLSAVVALAGLAGVVVGDMQLRNLGILGYAVIFPAGAAVLAAVFRSAMGRGARQL